jgi:hypothetical protein
MAQVPQYYQAHSEGRFDDAAARRETARLSLDHARFDANQVLTVFRLYETAGLTAQARAVLQSALSRTQALGESHPSRIQLYRALADSWLQDRNLLRSLTYFERLAAAMETAPAAAGGAQTLLVMDGCCFGRNCFNAQGIQGVYRQLTELYRQLGRPDGVAAVLKKMRANDPISPVLANYYENQGQLDEVAAIYKAQIEQAAAADPKSQPWQRLQPLQSLAWLYQRDGRSSDAIALLQQGIASMAPDDPFSVIGLRQNLASILEQSGQQDAAESIYRQLLVETRDDENHQGYATGAVTAYANFLSMTKRSQQAEAFLNDYMASHGNLAAWEQSNLLYALAGAADAAGDPKRAAGYRSAAEEKQRSMQAPVDSQVLIAKELQDAMAAAQAGKVQEAFTLAMRALDLASHAADRDQLTWLAPSIASSLLAGKSPDLAEQLYQRLFVVLQSWSNDTVQPLLTVLAGYPNFLMQQQARWNEVPAAIERYRAALITARGDDTGHLQDVLKATIQFERTHAAFSKAIPVAQELLALEESLAGTTSETYLDAAVGLAELYESAGEAARGIQLRSEMIPIADLVYAPGDARRGWIRVNTAFSLARNGDFEQAERLVNEAIAIGKQVRPAQPNLFAEAAGQIRQIKKESESEPRPIP